MSTMQEEYTMQPQVGDTVVSIPYNLGVKGGVFRSINLARLIFVAIGYIVFISLGLLCLFSLRGFLGVIWFFIPIILYDLAVRYLIVNEKYYIKRFEELEKKNYMFDYTTFWNIHDMTESEPTVFSFASGFKGVYVSFERGETVGKTYQEKYDNEESIANMYKEAAITEGLSMYHFDYMDVVGNDERVDFLYDKLGNCNNSDIQDIVSDMYDNMYSYMNNVYTSYDVYLFYGRYDANTLLDKVKKVLNELKGSYYKYETILNKDDIVGVVHNMYPLNDFSVLDTIDKVLNRESESNYIRILELEKNGEVTVVNKASKDIKREQTQRRKEKQIHFKHTLGKKKNIEL